MNMRVIVIAAAIGVAGVVFAVRRQSPARGGTQEAALPPLPKRVKVEVLNAGKTPGVARVATLVLRRAGLDVVNYSNAGPAGRNVTRNQVLVRHGDTTGTGRIVAALGDAEIVDMPDDSRLVDLSVILAPSYGMPRKADSNGVQH